LVQFPKKKHGPLLVPSRGGNKKVVGGIGVEGRGKADEVIELL
jgi:hypothetical protein